MEEQKFMASTDSPLNRNNDSVSPSTTYYGRMTGPSEFSKNWVELRLMGQ